MSIIMKFYGCGNQDKVYTKDIMLPSVFVLFWSDYVFLSCHTRVLEWINTL